MAKCDICDRSADWEHSFVLVTSEVVLSRAYWDFVFAHQWAGYVEVFRSETAAFEVTVRQQAEQSCGWLVCPSCSGHFQFDRESAASYAKHRNTRPSGGGPAGVDATLRVARTALLDAGKTVDRQPQPTLTVMGPDLLSRSIAEDSSFEPPPLPPEPSSRPRGRRREKHRDKDAEKWLMYAAVPIVSASSLPFIMLGIGLLAWFSGVYSGDDSERPIPSDHYLHGVEKTESVKKNDQGTSVLLWFVGATVCSTCGLAAGIAMFARRGYRIAVVGAVVAMLPISPLAFLLLPSGLIALIALLMPRLKKQFRRPTPPPKTQEPIPPKTVVKRTVKRKPGRWSQQTSEGKPCTQIIYDELIVQPGKSRGQRGLDNDQLEQLVWGLVPMKLQNSEAMELYAKASGTADQLKGIPCRFAVALYKYPESPVVQFILEIEHDPANPFVVEASCDMQNQEMRDAFFEVINLQRITVHFIRKDMTLAHSRVFRVSKVAHQGLKKLWTDAEKADASIAPQERDYEAALKRYNVENPIVRSPILKPGQSDQETNISATSDTALEVPRDRVAALLASNNDVEYAKGVAVVMGQAESRDRTGINKLEALIWANTPAGECSFHQPGVAVFHGTVDFEAVAEELTQLAESPGGLFAHVADVQKTISRLALDPSTQHSNYSARAKERIQLHVGIDQAHCFELLYLHLIANATYIRAMR